MESLLIAPILALSLGISGVLVWATLQAVFFLMLKLAEPTYARSESPSRVIALGALSDTQDRRVAQACVAAN